MPEAKLRVASSSVRQAERTLGSLVQSLLNVLDSSKNRVAGIRSIEDIIAGHDIIGAVRDGLPRAIHHPVIVHRVAGMSEDPCDDQRGIQEDQLLPSSLHFSGPYDDSVASPPHKYASQVYIVITEGFGIVSFLCSRPIGLT